MDNRCHRKSGPLTFDMAGKLVLVALCATLSWSARAAPPGWLNPSWAANALWDDGKAEVSHYDTTRTIYGKPRFHDTTVVVVKEDFTPQFMVKADKPGETAGAFPVLKMHLVAERIDTENYPYDFAASVFVERADPSRCVRATVTSHEWCGITFKSFKGWLTPPLLETRSYWDGEGDAARSLQTGVVPLEAVPLILRSMDFAGKVELKSLPDLLNNRAGKPSILNLSAWVDGEETIEVPAGRFECHRVNVIKIAEGEPEAGAPPVAPGRGTHLMTLWIEKAFPNRIILRADNDGTRFALHESERRAYWERR
jgi:hypothetical protein